jgi:hypothetical protein
LRISGCVDGKSSSTEIRSISRFANRTVGDNSACTLHPPGSLARSPVNAAMPASWPSKSCSENGAPLAPFQLLYRRTDAHAARGDPLPAART